MARKTEASIPKTAGRQQRPAVPATIGGRAAARRRADRDVLAKQQRSGDGAVAVVIPCYRVRHKILDVLARIGPEVSRIYVVDDACTEQSGRFVERHCSDPRVRVLYNEVNRGVGGAVIAGYRAALADGISIIVKIDGDGQMAPELLPDFIAPIRAGLADYTKGNRFYSLYNVRAMPKIRLFGNAVLSFMTKLSSGYWSVFDPTNGYTAIHRVALGRIDLGNLSERYFFESDMLVKLGAERAVVVCVPMEAVYADEKSGLSIVRVIPEFLRRHSFESIRRLIYKYLVRDFNLASLHLLCGLLLLAFGTGFGAWKWFDSLSTERLASTGTVMLSALPVILGVQLLLSFFAYDIASEPRTPLCRLLARRRKSD